MALPSVDLVYTLPPPYGGVSVHVKRLYERLRQAGVDCRSYLSPRLHPGGRPNCDSTPLMPECIWKYPSTWRWLTRYGLRSPKAVTHIQDDFSWSSVIFALRWAKRPVVLTVHDIVPRSRICRTRPYERWAAKWIVRDRGIRWIAVSERAQAELVSMGVCRRTVSVIPAYLPPVVEGASDVLPPDLQAFAQQRAPLLAVYGSRLMRDPLGQDAYGFDIACEAIAKLKAEYPNVGLVILIPNLRPAPEAERLRGLITKLKIETNVLLWSEPLPEAWPLWRRADIYVRPSTMDGDAIAVREALYVGTPVVASDAVWRPKGVLLHKCGDRDDLIRAIKHGLANGQAAAGDRDEGEANFEAILAVYRSSLTAQLRCESL
jgi:glycosyltransferase involved in cell wall biosynthesis